MKSFDAEKIFDLYLCWGLYGRLQCGCLLSQQTRFLMNLFLLFSRLFFVLFVLFFRPERVKLTSSNLVLRSHSV